MSGERWPEYILSQGLVKNILSIVFFLITLHPVNSVLFIVDLKCKTNMLTFIFRVIVPFKAAYKVLCFVLFFSRSEH